MLIDHRSIKPNTLDIKARLGLQSCLYDPWWELSTVHPWVKERTWISPACLSDASDSNNAVSKIPIFKPTRSSGSHSVTKWHQHSGQVPGWRQQLMVYLPHKSVNRELLPHDLPPKTNMACRESWYTFVTRKPCNVRKHLAFWMSSIMPRGRPTVLRWHP